MQQRLYLWTAALGVLVAGFLIYLPGLNGPFVFDDLTNILQTPGIRISDLTLGSLHQALLAREYDTFIGRPVAMLSFALNYYFTQLDAFYFKVTNVVIHLASGLALYALTIILLRCDQQRNPNSPYTGTGQLSWLALAITAAWLLHPLSLTSVLYVVQRMTSLSALFMILGLIGYCLGREQLLLGKKLGLFTIFASLAFFGTLATLCKENGVLVLPLAAVLEIAFYRFATHSSLNKMFRTAWFLGMLLPIVLALTVVLIQHERWFGQDAYRFRDFSLEERLLTQSRVVWFYLKLVFLPDIAEMGLHHDDFPKSEGLLQPVSTLPALLGITALIAVALIARIRFPILFFAIAWFFVGHSIESSALPLEMVHEHRNYLPQYGLLFAAVYFVAAPYRHPALGRTLRLRLGFVVIYAVLLGIATYSRSIQWQDDMTLHTREVANHPASARSQLMLGALMHAYGFPDQAQRHLTIAANLRPDQPDYLVRLVQHIYLTTGTIPSDILEELRYRLAHGLASDTTLWVYEPLLSVTRDNPKVHDQIIEMFAAVLHRNDVRFNPRWYEMGYRLLAENHDYRGRARSALQYYEQARSLRSDASYDIAIARLYAKNGCFQKARDLVASIGTSEVSRDQNGQLPELEKLLSGGDRASSRCTL